MIGEFVADQGNVFQGALMSVFLAAGLAGLFIWRFQNRLHEISLLIVISISFTFIVSPYLLSYDFVLLLVSTLSSLCLIWILQMERPIAERSEEVKPDLQFFISLR